MVAVLMSGCASRYVEPASGPYATVVFSTEDRASMVVNVVEYEGDAYLEHKGDVVAQLSRASVGYVGDAVERRVPAGREFRFTYRNHSTFLQGGSSVNYICVSHLSFVPEPGGRYFVDNGIDHAQRCWVSVEKEVRGAKVPDSTVKRLKSCIDPVFAGRMFESEQCRPGFRFR